MIRSVNKICTACMGLGIVEGVQKVARNPSNPLDVPVEEPIERDSDECYVCKGRGHIPTGFFVIIPTEASQERFLDQLGKSPEYIQKAIKSKI